MKKTVSWNGLIAMAAILAMSVWVFGCTDTQTTSVANPPESKALKGSIVGHVVDINNNPIEGAKATLRYPGGSSTQKTGSDGGYLFTGVPVSGQLGCDNDCDENPYLIVVKSPVIKVDREKVTPYVTAYTAALLSFTTLRASGAYELDALTGDWQAVGDLQVEAIPAVMRRPNAIVKGYVINTTTGLPAAGALATLNPFHHAGPPDVSTIWNSERSTMAIGDPTAVSDTDGLFTFLNVPEGSDTWPVRYTVTITGDALQVCNFCGYPVAVVGTGNHEYWVDADCGTFVDDNSWNQADAVALCPALPPSDVIDPFVIATNLPPNSVIPAALAGASFCWQFNEPMNLVQGDVTINQTGAGPIQLNELLTGWNLPIDSGCPDGTAANPVYTATPAAPLPEGRSFVFALNNMEDLAGNQYEGRTPANTPDAFDPDDTGAPIVSKNLRTGGDPTLMCVMGLGQDAAVLDPTQPIGGLAGNVPQANNLNLLFCRDGMDGLTEIGDQNEEANWISLSWTAAAPCVAEEDGVVSGYNVYADNTGLGFVAGIPVEVGSTGTAFGDPPTSWMGYLEGLPGPGSFGYMGHIVHSYLDNTVNTGIYVYNNNNSPGDPDVPFVDPPNVFDDGFMLPMAVTAVNNDMREGPYSNVAQIMDVVPPTTADQGLGVDDEGLIPTLWPFLWVGAEEVGLYPTETIPSIPGLGDPEIGDGNTYDSDRYNTWLAVPRGLDIGMNEDLLSPQTVGYVLQTTGGGGESIASASVTQPEIGPDECDLPTITAVMNNLALVQQGDNIGITAMDEAGNVSDSIGNAGSRVILADGVVPLITTGTVVSTTGTEEVMTLTYAEPLCVDDALAVPPVVCDHSADDITSYYLNSTSNMGSLPGPIAAAVDETGMIVTLTAPLGFGVTDATYLVLGLVEDLQGNMQDITAMNPGGALWFAVDDQIAPVMTSCYHSSAPDINIGAATPSDGVLSVGDDFTTDGTDVFNITCDISESLDTGVAVSFTGAATCTRTGTLTLTTTDVNFDLTCTAGVIAGGNSVVVTGFDLAGNPLTPAMILGPTADTGTNIDPAPAP
jgi:hypothetical protein